MRKRVILPSIVSIFVVSAIVLLIWILKSRDISRLSRDAMLMNGTVAIESLGKDSSRESLEALLHVAKYSSFGENRKEAIRTISKRSDNDGAELAMMLQPSEALAIREEVATALLNSQCNRLCVERIIEYLERRYHSEPTIEEITSNTVSGDDYKVENTRLEESLLKELARQPKITSEILETKYGLNKVPTTLFPIDLASRLKLTDVCPGMINAHSLLVDYIKKEDDPLALAIAKFSATYCGRYR